MHQHNNHNLGSRIQVEGMRINAQSGRRRHQYGKRASLKARLIGLIVLLMPVVAVLVWANS